VPRRSAPAAGRPKGLRDLDEIEAVFGALAHATRRHILLVLQARGGAMTSGELASRFACSWPTTTRHLRVLEEAGLVSVAVEGRERRYRLERARLRDATARYLGAFGG
jgi:DNA-binding transcriptional ArsR family regulator